MTLHFAILSKLQLLSTTIYTSTAQYYCTYIRYYHYQGGLEYYSTIHMTYYEYDYARGHTLQSRQKYYIDAQGTLHGPVL